MENHFIDELLNQIFDMQNFVPLSDELSAMLSQYDSAEYELEERNLDFVVAAQGNLDYQAFLSLAEKYANNRIK